MITLARDVGWLTEREASTPSWGEWSPTFPRDSDSAGYGEVDLICALNKDRKLDDALELRGLLASGGQGEAQETVREARRARASGAPRRARVRRS